MAGEPPAGTGASLRLRPQHGPRAVALARPVTVALALEELRDEVRQLGELVRLQQQMLESLAQALTVRLEAAEAVIEARAAAPAPPLTQFRTREANLEPGGRRPPLGRGLEALIPSRD